PAVTFEATVAGAPRAWQGRVVRTDAAIDPQTRILHAIAEVRDPYGAAADDGAPLAVGLFVGARIEGRRVEGGVVIPRTALRNLVQVFVAMPDDTLDIRTVEVVTAGGETAVLSGGVAPGERVIVSPLQSAVRGMPLTPVPLNETAPAGGGGPA